MSALASAGGHSRKMSLVSATPTAVLPSLRMATELDGAAKGGARRNIDTWYQLLTSLAVSVPSPELAVELDALRMRVNTGLLACDAAINRDAAPD